MYNPKPNDNYNEWIELYNPTNQSINISGWSITDNSGEDYLEADFDHGNGTLTIPSYGYAVITDHGTKAYENYIVANNTVCLYIDDKSIGNGLSNNGDKIILKNNLSETIDCVEWIVNYSDVPGDPAKKVDENLTLSRYRFGNSSSTCFYEGFPTPGYKNNINMIGKISLDVEQNIFLMKKGETRGVILNVKNFGDFSDNISLEINGTSPGWFVDLENNVVNLYPNQEKNISLTVTSSKNRKSRYCNITIIAKSGIDANESDEEKLFFETLGSDLLIKKVKIYNENKLEKKLINQGEIIRIKAFLKNTGKEKTSDVVVGFYYDFIDDEHYIGCKCYDSVGRYQKYPSILWDTINVKSGHHKILVVADIYNSIEEFDESNNVLSCDIKIFNTSPSNLEKQILISDVYYHTHPGINNEYIKIYNPSSEKIDISGWYFTNNPLKNKIVQNKIIFSEKTRILPNNFLVLSQNASAYLWETGKKPDFEYNANSDKNIPQMNSSKNLTLSNKGGYLALKNRYNHTIDTIVYGNVDYNLSGWNGKPIPSSNEGIILKRNSNKDGQPIDTNTSFDWTHPREYRIGQSDFSYQKIRFNGKIRTFISPDSSFETIASEIRNTSNCIYLNIYEFTSLHLCDELIKTLLKNVSINILLDGSPVGGISLEEKYLLKRIANYGGNIRFIKNNRDNKVYGRYSFNHGKYLVIDNSTVIIESCNWAETGIPLNPSFGNREWGVVIKNSSVANYFLNVFLEDWDLSRCDIFSIDKMNLKVPSNFYLMEKTYKGYYESAFSSNRFIGNFTIYPVLSPDTSYQAIYDMINSANNSIYIEQLYIYKDWDQAVNPFVECLVNKSKNGIDVKVILNYNPFYGSTNDKCNETKIYLEENGIEVKYIYTNWSIFTNVHNKGMIVDNKSVLISSINWNENSVISNREAGIIIENESIARYYSKVFFYDWHLQPLQNKMEVEKLKVSPTFDENTIYIVVIFTMTFALIARDWRKRKCY